MNSLEYREWVSKHVEIGKEVLYLTRDECVNIGLTEEDILELTEKALVAHGKKNVEMPAKIGLHPLKDTLMHAMPAYIPEVFACGIKWGACFPANRERFGLNQTSVLLVFNDSESGWPLAIMDASWITEKRTPAVSVIAAKYLAKADAKTFGMIGCGVQGRAHVKVISHVLRGLEKIYIYDVYRPAMDRLVEDLQPEVEAEIIKAGSYEELAKNSEVIASAAIISAKPEPKIKDEWISKGQTIIMCDCHSLYEDVTMKRADKYLCDSIEQHELLIGYGYYPYGLPEIYGETGEVVAGLKKGRETNDELIVCNNVGMAVEDMMMARAVFDRALQKGVGRKLPL
ncbi:MAG: ornithine cyclodeaminase family protein [Firmicutes bacterium]|nr:ornithine cyclodeaminase family protein [Bacillota bacterium]NSW92486.1 ornithine cyclodeaminase family protein [Bacillota bacterium]